MYRCIVLELFLLAFISRLSLLENLSFYSQRLTTTAHFSCTSLIKQVKKLLSLPSSSSSSSSSSSASSTAAAEGAGEDRVISASALAKALSTAQDLGVSKADIDKHARLYVPCKSDYAVGYVSIMLLYLPRTTCHLMCLFSFFRIFPTNSLERPCSCKLGRSLFYRLTPLLPLPRDSLP